MLDGVLSTLEALFAVDAIACKTLSDEVLRSVLCGRQAVDVKDREAS